ncbi:MAG: hypothetical protein NTW16_19555 [Bacteroidetes bacterium]|nr:hypothetical protein [Bacteroidota bacterium]
MTITIPKITFNGFYFDRAIFDNQWLLEGLQVDHPSVSVEVQQAEKKEAGTVRFDPAAFIRLPLFMKTCAIRKISISGANVGLNIHSPGKTRSWSRFGHPVKPCRNPAVQCG